METEDKFGARTSWRAGNTQAERSTREHITCARKYLQTKIHLRKDSSDLARVRASSSLDETSRETVFCTVVTYSSMLTSISLGQRDLTQKILSGEAGLLPKIPLPHARCCPSSVAHESAGQSSAKVSQRDPRFSSQASHNTSWQKRQPATWNCVWVITTCRTQPESMTSGT